MMAVIGFRLRPSEQNRAAVLRQAIGYIWVPPPENPLGLEHTVRFRPTATQGKSALPSRLRWKTPPFGVPVYPVAAHHSCGKTPRVGLPDPKGGQLHPSRRAFGARGPPAGGCIASADHLAIAPHTPAFVQSDYQNGRALCHKVLDINKPACILSSGGHPWIWLHHRQSSLSALPSPTPPAFGNAAVFTTTLFSPPLPPSASLLLVRTSSPRSL